MNNIGVDIIHEGFGTFWVKYHFKNNRYKNISEVNNLHPRQVRSLIVHPEEVIWQQCLCF